MAEASSKNALFISYDGSVFHGFQVQPEVDTVQGRIFNCLRGVAAQRIGDLHFSYSGRTDAGVSALWQTVSFVSPSDVLQDLIECISSNEGLVVWGVRERLPVEFHASKAGLFRDYVYVDRIDEYRCSDIPFLRSISRQISGMTDFSFLYKDWREPPFGSAMRRVYFIEPSEIGPYIILHIRGEAFVWNMVRRIVDFLRKCKCDEKLRACIKDWTPGAAEPDSLFLVGVKYPYTPRLLLNVWDIFERTFARSKIRSSVLSVLREFLCLHRTAWSPCSLL